MGVTLEVTARFQTNVLLRPYGEYISLFQGMPRIFMPQFWIEQKFILDDEKASQIKLALDIPWYGQVVGISLTLVGIVLMSMTHLRRLVCKISDTDSKTLPVKSEAAEKGTVIKDYEMNPLMSPTHKSYNVKT